MSRSEDSVGTTRSPSPTGGQDRLRQQAEVLHAEHHTGKFVPTLDSCTEHDTEDYLTLAHEVHVEPALPQAPLHNHSTQGIKPRGTCPACDEFHDMDEQRKWTGPGQFAPIPDAEQAAKIAAAARDEALANALDFDGVPTGRLIQQWALVPGDIADPSHSYEGVLMEAADAAHARLIKNAAAEGRRLKRPVMVRVVVEAFTEPQ